MADRIIEYRELTKLLGEARSELFHYEVRATYDKVKGSAVNPVLREGNSDRRAPAPVKNYARNHPHSMGAWSPDSRTNVATMGKDDFRSNEKSVVLEKEGSLRIELHGDDGETTVLRDSVPVLEGEVVDATVMRVAALREFLTAQIERAREEDVLFSVHLKATMMKVSDPIIFGHVVETFLPSLFEQHGETLRKAGLSSSNGLGAILNGLDKLPADERAAHVGRLGGGADRGSTRTPRAHARWRDRSGRCRASAGPRSPRPPGGTPRASPRRTIRRRRR